MSHPRLVLLTPIEVADTLRIHKTTIYRWIKDGKIPHIRLPSGDVRIRESDSERWLTDRSRAAASSAPAPAPAAEAAAPPLS